jgi:hypothetical protein
MTTLLAESTGQLSIAVLGVQGQRIEELAFQSAAEVVDGGEALIVVDAAGCFDPGRMTHSARIGAIDPAGLLKHLHILRARSAAELEDLILLHLETAFERLGTRHVLIPDLLGKLYDPAIQTRDAARILGRIKARLEELTENGAQIVVLCRETVSDLGTRAHFLSSLCASADRVYFRNNT